MKDKHTINLILISSKWVIPSFGVCSWWINSSSKYFHIFFSEVQISTAISSEHPSKSPLGSSYSFVLHFYLIILLSPEFFMVVLHDLIHSSRVHQDFVGGVQVSFFSRLEVQLILRILLKWSFAFLLSSQLFNLFRSWSVISS